MLLKRKELEISESDPFNNNKFNRETHADILTTLLKSLDEPFVLALDSGWGAGKTTFIRMWDQKLKNDGFTTLYFNAWENDFSEDPLISFIGEIQSNIKINSLKGSAKKQAKAYWDKTKKIGKAIGKRTIPIGAKIATIGALDLDKEIETAIGQISEKVLEDSINSYADDKNNLSLFRDNLEKYVTFFRKESETETKPVVFFIDELDRCKPTYAIALLERLKHLFNVKGIAFILALDKEQLSYSVQCLYGSNMNSEGYLRRFFDLDYHLQTPSYTEYTQYLFNHFEFDTIFSKISSGPHKKKQLIDSFSALSEAYNLKLRDMEQCFTKFTIALRTGVNDDINVIYLSALIVLKKADQTLYKNYINKSNPSLEVWNSIKKKITDQQFLRSNYLSSLEAFFVAGTLDQDEAQKLIKHYANEAASYSGTSQQNYYNHVKQVILRVIEYYPEPEINKLLTKLNIIENFTLN